MLLSVWSGGELKENFTFMCNDLSFTCGSLGKQVVNRIRNSTEGGEASDFLKRQSAGKRHSQLVDDALWTE